MVAVDTSENGAAAAWIDVWCGSGAAGCAQAVSTETGEVLTRAGGAAADEGSGESLGAALLGEALAGTIIVDVAAVGWVCSTCAEGAAVTAMGGATAE